MAAPAPLMLRAHHAHPRPPAVSPGLPDVRPTPAARRDEVDGQGRRVKRLESSDGRCFQVVRHLCDCLMGKVELAVELQLIAGVWTVPPARAGPPGTQAYSYVAIKQLYKYCVAHGVTTDHRPVKENPMQEIAAMTLLNDPGYINVMKLIAFLEDTERLYLVLEYLDGGELFQQVASHGHAPEDAARRFMWQMVLGTKYMHARGLAHRDISLENGMVTSDPQAGTVKLIDFGLAIPIPPPVPVPGTDRMQPGTIVADAKVGKEKYMPPEMFALQPYDPVKVDVWTLGVSTFVLLFGTYPYQIASVHACRYFAQIASGGLLAMLHSWHYDARVTPEALSFMNVTLRVDPRERASIEDLVAHPWFAPIRDTLAPGALDLRGLPPPLVLTAAITAPAAGVAMDLDA